MAFDNLDTYNGDTEHDMWVDFDIYKVQSNRGLLNRLQTPQNTGTPDIFDELDLDDFVNNLNNWD